VIHTASARFWRCYDALPADIRALADKNFKLLETNPSHPSLHFKFLAGGKLYSSRVGLHYRALRLPRESGVHWFWVGTHAEYDRLVDA
jgi:hypothetical protein